MAIVHQVLCTFIICSQGLNYGLVSTWPSSTMSVFSSTNTTLNRPMTDLELALFGSLSSVGALVSTPLSGFLLDCLGRKYTCFLFSIPYVLAWVLIIIFTKVESILVAMFIAGLGGCLFTISPVFISEFCNVRIRGAMASCPMVFYGIGILISYIFGGYLNYHIMNYTCLSIAILSVVLMPFLRESPTFLMKKGLEMNAAKAIAFFWSTTESSTEVLEEMDMLRRTLNPDLDGAKSKEEKLKNPEEIPKKLSVMTYLRKSKSTRRGLVITVILWSFSAFQGLIAVQVNAGPLFAKAMPAMSSTLTAIIFSVIFLICSVIAAYLTDVIGRRWLMIGPSTVAGVCCVVIGTQIQLDWGPNWMSTAFLYGYLVAYIFGAGTVPYVIVADVFLPEVRGVLSTLSLEWAWICNFLVLFTFNPIASSLGLGSVFYIFSIVCFISTIFTYFFLPETKGLTVEVIQTLLIKRAY